NVPGAPVPIKRYVSSPEISFQTGIMSSDCGEDDPFLGADDPTLPLDATGRVRRRDQRNDNSTLLYPGQGENSDDIAAKRFPRGTSAPKFKKVTVVDKNGKLVTRLFRVKGVNACAGETVLMPGSDDE